MMNILFSFLMIFFLLTCASNQQDLDKTEPFKEHQSSNLTDTLTVIDIETSFSEIEYLIAGDTLCGFSDMFSLKLQLGDDNYFVNSKLYKACYLEQLPVGDPLVEENTDILLSTDRCAYRGKYYKSSEYSTLFSEMFIHDSFKEITIRCSSPIMQSYSAKELILPLIEGYLVFYSTRPFSKNHPTLVIRFEGENPLPQI